MADRSPPPDEMGTELGSGQSISLPLYLAKPSDGPSIFRKVLPAVRTVHGPAAAHATTQESLQAAPPPMRPVYSMLPRVR